MNNLAQRRLTNGITLSYLNKGIVRSSTIRTIEWAKANSWERIEADSFEDIPVIYEITGSAGHTFWENMGFHQRERSIVS